MVLISVTGFLLAVLLILTVYMKGQERKIFKFNEELYENEINSLLNLYSEPYTGVLGEVTYWDEFVDFYKTKNLKWFDITVANILKINDVDYISAYDLQGNFVTKISNAKIKTRDFIPKSYLPKLYEKRIDKFYYKIPEGVVEIFAATVHPSEDPFKNKTNPEGYFFIVRLIDEKYFSSIEKISTSKITFYKGSEKEEKTVSTIIPLRDYNGNIVNNLYFKRAYNLDFWVAKFILLAMGIAIVLANCVYYFYSVKWARLPISLIKKILVKEDKASIESLKNIQGEFRYIGKLFEQNILQRTQLQSAKQKAEESDKLKSAFLTNLSHEIRTPLNAIIGFSELLENKEITEKDKIEYRKIINKSGRNLITNIDDLIEMSRIDANQVNALYSDFDLNKLMSIIHDSTVKSIYDEKDIEFNLINVNPNFTRKIISDKVKLERIIKSLISNAIKFTDKGLIVLAYEVDEVNKRIIFNVKDSGIGIEAQNFQSIFKRFSKVQNDHTIRGGGLGLGLAIAKEYVKMLNGEIFVHSEFGVGTTFTFHIPLMIDKSAVNINSEYLDVENETNIKKISTILVAEDDKFNFILIEKILKLRNYLVIHAEDGEKAVQLCAENSNIDLVLMDIKMPKMDGYQSFIKINTMRPKLPIVAQTAYTSSEEMEKIFQLGFTAYISKPINKDKLYSIIETIEKA